MRSQGVRSEVGRPRGEDRWGGGGWGSEVDDDGWRWVVEAGSGRGCDLFFFFFPDADFRQLLAAAGGGGRIGYQYPMNVCESL